MKPAYMSTLIMLVALPLYAAPAQEIRYEIDFPDLPGYRTLTCDLHMHTVFSDGQVWPPVRVAEAWRQGLDAIAITDHIEVQPHKQDVPTNHNRPYDLSAGSAKTHDLLLFRSTEITRDTPPGHFNAIFLEDIDPLDTEDFVEAVGRAAGQGAFIFWNHQEWKGPEKGRWLDVHTTLFDNGWLHGMEVCNNTSYYPSAHRWCLEKNLTMIGNSDIHAPDLLEQNTSDEHRTMTLVFAAERTPEAVKDALIKGRTAVWFENQIIGRREYLEPLFAGCVEITAAVRAGRYLWLHIRNNCSADIQLAGADDTALTLTAGATTLIRMPAGKPTEPIELNYTATNFLIAPDTGLPVVLKIPAQ